jgi:Phosphotransferase enzyme family
VHLSAASRRIRRPLCERAIEVWIERTAAALDRPLALWRHLFGKGQSLGWGDEPVEIPRTSRMAHPWPRHHECQNLLVEAELVSRAMAAASSLAGALDLRVDDIVVVHNSNKLALRLLPCDVFARVALVGQEVFALEVELARRLVASASPMAALEPRVDPRVYEGDGFAMTLWTHYEVVTSDQISPVEYAAALHRLHVGMRRAEIAAPHFTERVAQAVRLVADPIESPALAGPDRDLLLSSLRGAREEILRCGAPEQLLHGEPHSGNVLNAHDGPLFIDFETCCRGPIEFDVAHVPDEVSGYYPNIDRPLLQKCRRLVLAMVGAWRWDIRDEFPDGHRHGRDILTLLREGPPWPALGPLAAD